MKAKKLLALAGVSVAGAFFLAACGGGSSNQATYSFVYSADPNTLDYIAATRTTTSDVTSNLVDGLLENDRYGNFVPSLAEDWTVSEDGLTYTYKLRKDAKWYTSEGEEYGAVTAQDFITGIKHAVESKSEGLFLIQNSIKGLDAYVKGETKDFNTVGVKALDDHTIQYTLVRPESFWNSKTTSGVLFPVNADFLKSQGKDFGSLKPSSILYNGPFYLKSLTSKSEIELVKNKDYYDAKNVHIDNVKLTFNDGSNPDSIIKNFEKGQYSFASVMPNSSTYKSVKKNFGDNIVYGLQLGTSYYLGFNLDRQKYDHTAKTTDEQKASTKKAILNKDFRQAVNFGFDRKSYAAQVSGADAAENTLRSTLVPPTYVQVNGEDFGKVVEKQLVTYGDQWKGVSLDDGQTSLYSPEKAKASFAKAKAELQKQGVQFPIHLDMPVDQTAKTKVARAQSLKQSVEETLGKENVVVDLNQMSQDDLLNATLSAPNAAAEDWDITDSVAWAPDYEDPSTYLDIFKTTASENTKTYMGFDDPNNAAAAQVGLKDFDALVDNAAKETSDLNVRYERYAEAQAWLEDSSLFMPLMVNKGAAPMVARLTPFSGAYSQVGPKGSDRYFKYLEPQKDVVTKKNYDKARESWLKEKSKSNEKAQKDLEKHVK